MANPLDSFPYVWSSPEAQELHVALCEIYPTAKGALFVAEKAGIRAWELNVDQSPYFLWKNILDESASRGILRELAKLVSGQNKGNPRRQFLDDLLANKPIVSSSPRGPDGEAPFDDTIGEPEALLFHDDLTLSTGRLSWLIAILEKLRSLAPAVCRLVCDYKGSIADGTGFRIGPDVLLTNWHVLHNPHLNLRATAVTALFGYEQDVSGKPLAELKVDCTVSSIVTGDMNADWGVIRTAQPLPDTIPILRLSEAVDPVKDEPAFLIQHPKGSYKRIGYVRNQITQLDDRYLFYLTDTQQGSSGAPVLDDQGRLIGLHHFGGAPQEIAGKPPLKKNRGVRIPVILAGLQDAGITVP